MIGPSFTFQQVPEVISRLLQVYVRERIENERFIDTVRRIGHAPFKEYVYATPVPADDRLDDGAYGLLKDPDAVAASYHIPYYSPRF
mgnify:FL=1